MTPEVDATPSAATCLKRLRQMDPAAFDVLVKLTVLPNNPFAFHIIMAVTGVRPAEPAQLKQLNEVVVGSNAAEPDVAQPAVQNLQAQIQTLESAGLLTREGSRWQLGEEARAQIQRVAEPSLVLQAQNALIEHYVDWIEYHQDDVEALEEERPWWTRAINAAQMLQQNHAFLLLAGWLSGVGGYFRQKRDLETCRRVLEQAVAVMARQKTADRAWISFQYGSLLHECGDLERAEAMLLQSLELALSEGMKHEAASARGGLAIVAAKMGNNEAAIRWYSEQLEELRVLAAPQEFAETCLEFADVLVQEQAYDDALELLQQRLELLELMGEHLKSATTILMVGDIYGEKGELQESIRCYEEALPTLEAQDPRNGAVARANLGIYLHKHGDLEAARQALEEAEAALETLELTEMAASVRTTLQELF